MRPPILAAVMPTLACASSPEPASTPTPASDSAALARTAPRAAITAREQYYDIDGSSAGALRNQISRLGPKDESGTSHDALTVWSLEWTYGTAQRGDGCALRDVKVTLNVSVTLPRWKPPPTATAELLKTWQAYLKAVRVHEAGPRTLAERNARAVDAPLTALPRASCERLSDEATRTAGQIVADGRARNPAYDVQTRHGQTQGVELGP